MFDVSGKSAIVTGSARGLGKAFATSLLAAGAKVCISDVNEKLGEETQKELAEKFGKDKVIFVKCDVTQEDQLRHLWEEAVAKIGYVSLMINNAGVNSKFSWHKCLEIMLNGVIHGMVLAREKMSKKEGGQGGRIVNIASVAGLTGLPDHQLERVMGYVTAKTGVVGLTRSFGQAKPNVWETEGIKCYALCPMFVDTVLVREEVTKEEIESMFHVRCMEPEELGQSLMDALKLDSNGACLPVVPDAPLVDLPNFNWGMITVMAILGKILRALGYRVATLNPYFLIVGTILPIFVIFYLLSFLLCIFC